MQGLFKFNRRTTFGDPISNCAKGLKDLDRLKHTFPVDDGQTKQLVINLKA